MEVSSRQFLDALARSVETSIPQDPDFDYWVYVVEQTSAGWSVVPIKNPALRSRRFELRAATWRDLADDG